MDRREFIGRVGLFIGGLAVGRHVGLPPAVEQGVVRDSVLTPVADYRLVASGGLCAPMSPIYDMRVFAMHPVRDALPKFTAERGGVISGS